MTLKRFLSLFILTCLIITTPGGDCYQALAQAQENESKAQKSLEKIFDAKDRLPSDKNSSLPAKGPNQSKAKSLDGKLIAQVTQGEHLRRACLDAVKITGGLCDVKADPPAIQKPTPSPASSPPLQATDLSGMSARSKWGLALGILGLLGVLAGVAMVGAGPAVLASASLSLTAAYAVIGVSSGLAALGLLVAKGEYILPAIGVPIGGLLAGLLHNLLLGFVDLKIDSDATWAKVFNVSQEIGKWLTLIGGMGAGFTLGGLGLTGILPAPFIPAGFAVGGAMTLSAVAQALTALVKHLKKVTPEEVTEERGKAAALSHELAEFGVSDEEIAQALAPISIPESPDSSLSQEEQNQLRNRARYEFFKKQQVALEELKEQNLSKRKGKPKKKITTPIPDAPTLAGKEAQDDKEKKKIKTRRKTKEKIKKGMTVYRVWGGDSREWGEYWTTIDPRTVTDFQSRAGLPGPHPKLGRPFGNTGEFLTLGTLIKTEGVIPGFAKALESGQTGGLFQLEINNSKDAIEKIEPTEILIPPLGWKK